MHKGTPHRGRRLIRPDRIDHIPHRAQGHIRPGKRRTQTVNLIRRMQPRIKPHHTTGQILANPITGLHLGPRYRGKGRQIDLTLHLHPVAAINEHARHIGQHPQGNMPLSEVLALYGFGFQGGR